MIGLLKRLSTSYRNQQSLFSAPKPLDWSEQIVLITGGTCWANQLVSWNSIFTNRILWNWRITREYACSAQCNYRCSRHKAHPNGKPCVLDLISRVGHSPCSSDNITYYKCDISKWEEVEAVSKKVVEGVSSLLQDMCLQTHKPTLGWPSDHACQQRRRSPRETDP